MSRSLAVLLLLAIAARGFANGGQVDREVARSHLEAALIAVELGLEARARDYLDAALSFWPDYGDALYLAGMMRTGDRGMTTACIDLLERATESDGFERYRPAEAAVALVGVLYRVREYDRAQSVADRVDLDDPLLSRATEAELLYLRARLAAARGSIAQAVVLAESGTERYPNDPRFLSIRLRSDSPADLRYRRALERLEPGDNRRAYLQLLLNYGLAAPTESEKAWAVSRYRSLDGGDPMLSLLAAQAGGATEEVVAPLRESEVMDLTVARKVEAFLRGDTRADTEATLAALHEYARSFSGSAVVDDDRDGFWEHAFVVEDGRVVQWSVDPDQDGLFDYQVAVRDRIPVAVTLGGRLFGAHVRYERYPYVASAELEYHDGIERVYVIPSSVRFPIMDHLVDPTDERPELLKAWQLSQAAPVLPDELLMRSAYRSEGIHASGGAVDTYIVDEQPVRERRDLDGDGYFEEYAVFRDGFVVADVVDLDADGYFEVARQYSEYGVIFTAVDEDDDGTPELFIEDAGSELFEWDTNGDGTVDVREFRLWKERVIMDFPVLEERAR